MHSAHKNNACTAPTKTMHAQRPQKQCMHSAPKTMQSAQHTQKECRAHSTHKKNAQRTACTKRMHSARRAPNECIAHIADKNNAQRAARRKTMHSAQKNNAQYTTHRTHNTQTIYIQYTCTHKHIHTSVNLKFFLVDFTAICYRK